MKIKSHVNYYVIDRIDFILQHINRSTPGKRRWVLSDKYNSGYDYSVTERSTFPEYIKFAYVKRPKNWYELTEDEKSDLGTFYQYSTTNNIIPTLKKVRNGRALTAIQGQFIEELFMNFREYEFEWYYLYQEELIPEPDMSQCPF